MLPMKMINIRPKGTNTKPIRWEIGIIRPRRQIISWTEKQLKLKKIV